MKYEINLQSSSQEVLLFLQSENYDVFYEDSEFGLIVELNTIVEETNFKKFISNFELDDDLDGLEKDKYLVVEGYYLNEHFVSLTLTKMKD